MRYSINKSKTILFHVFRLFKKKVSSLSVSDYKEMVSRMEELEKAIVAKDKIAADSLARNLQTLEKAKFKKPWFVKLKDGIIAIAIALAVAFCIRQMWFELYEIPSGSMRPTLQEQDRLIVSKTSFGINNPLSLNQFYFDPDLTKRSGTFIFTGKEMDIDNVDTRYFYLFPGKKQYVKRMMGKPGDTLFFYGGKIYGIDQDGNDISPQLQALNIPHVPFLQFEGRVRPSRVSLRGVRTPVYLYQMNEKVARLSFTPYGTLKKEMLPPFNKLHYFDLWGFENYAMLRMLNRNDVARFYPEYPMEKNEYFLEINHHPNLMNATIGVDIYGRTRPQLAHYSSLLPLDDTSLHKLFESLYTSRFIVKDENAHSIAYTPRASSLIHLEGVPDGTYQIQDGKASRVLTGGLLKRLDNTHPLNAFDITRLYTLFNAGMDLNAYYLPEVKSPGILPSRFAYFDNGSLFVMNHELMKKDDKLLTQFLSNEAEKRSAATDMSPYFPFVDKGAPLNRDGTLDIEYIKTFGYRVPPKSYLALGDNYANSSDSREFGAVPESNIRGTPDFIFWPFGQRFGQPKQIAYPLFVMPRIIIWVLALLVGLLCYIIHKKRTKLPLKFD